MTKDNKLPRASSQCQLCINDHMDFQSGIVPPEASQMQRCHTLAIYITKDSKIPRASSQCQSPININMKLQTGLLPPEECQMHRCHTRNNTHNKRWSSIKSLLITDQFPYELQIEIVPPEASQMHRCLPPQQQPAASASKPRFCPKSAVAHPHHQSPVAHHLH